MTTIADNTPVIVGLGFHQVTSANPLDCPQPSELMLTALRNAADDCGNSTIVTEFESISVLRGSWNYSNPGKLLADELGCPDATSIMSEIGVLQMMPIFQLCDAIARDEKHVGAITGGEARFRDLRSLITGIEVSDTEQGEDTPEPDTFFRTPDAFSSELEAERGVWAPGEFYAMADSALRYARGQSIEQRRQEIAQMYSDFSAIAENNPHAWSKKRLSAAELLSSDNKNTMITFPFSKKVMSQWNVNQSVAIIICSYGKARAMNLDEDKFIYPMAYAQSRNVVNLAQKPTLHTHPGTVLTGKRAYELAEISADDIDVADLYSCFPSSITAGALDLDLVDKCPISVTGSMALAGGPYNHAAVDSVARMAEVLREMKNGERHIGLVTNISGMFGKQAAGLLSTTAVNGGFKFEDITDQVAEQEAPIAIDADFVGNAVIVAYSVMYNKGNMSHAIAYCDTPDGKRTVVRTDDKTLAQQMTIEEFVGKTVTVSAGGGFVPAR